MTDAIPETARLTADVVLTGQRFGQPHVLLVQRIWPPFAGCLALPGGHLDVGELPETAARRELAEETGLTAGGLRLIGVYAKPGRDPRGRYVTWAYLAQADGLPVPTPGDDARDALWRPLIHILAHPELLAFDHHAIIAAAEQMLT